LQLARDAVKMSKRPLLQLITVAALLAPTLSTGVALAETIIVEPAGFRGAIALEAGSILVPPAFTVGMVGVQGQAGVQVGAFALYAAPCVDFMFGRYRGMHVSVAPVLEYTFWSLIGLRDVSIGLGPVVGGFVGLVGPPRKDTSDTYIGGKLHIGLDDFVDETVKGHNNFSSFSVHATMLALGLDIYLVSYRDATRFAWAPSADTSENSGGALLWAMFSVGYKRW
jgi:hypothetical protein